MEDYFELGSSPNGEDCVQVDSTKDYYLEMKEELNRYKEMLQNIFPMPEDLGCYFKIKWFPHDFGKYGEVVIMFDGDDQNEIDFACFVEDNLPETWDDDEIREFTGEN